MQTPLELLLTALNQYQPESTLHRLELLNAFPEVNSSWVGNDYNGWERRTILYHGTFFEYDKLVQAPNLRVVSTHQTTPVTRTQEASDDLQFAIREMTIINNRLNLWPPSGSPVALAVLKQELHYANQRLEDATLYCTALLHEARTAI